VSQFYYRFGQGGVAQAVLTVKAVPGAWCNLNNSHAQVL